MPQLILDIKEETLANIKKVIEERHNVKVVDPLKLLQAFLEEEQETNMFGTYLEMIFEESGDFFDDNYAHLGDDIIVTQVD